VEDSREQLRKAPFDAIVMNGRMPGGFSAQEVYEWIATNCPGMEKKLLLTFASMEGEQSRNFLQEHGIATLSKPFEVGDLINRVRTLAQKSRDSDTQGGDHALKAEAGK
jgi:DNA-binding response OmpR family regulator